MIGLKFYLIIMSGITYFVVAFFLLSSQPISGCGNGVLYPQESETRQKMSLDGLWNFIQSNVSKPLDGYIKYWYKKRFSDLNETIELMPVPSSYNDITTDWKLRDHVGIVWYERYFYIPSTWSDLGRVWLRFGSVPYAAEVWINGVQVVTHTIGHLPFQVDVTNFVSYGKENRLTVACDNTLTTETIPQGKVTTLNSGRRSQTYTFDFFNYAGIDRSVFLYLTPLTYIDNINVATESIDGDRAVLNYSVAFNTSESNINCVVEVYDKAGIGVANSTCDQDNGQLIILSPKLWWPYLMDEHPGYLYTFQVKLLSKELELIDIYRLKIGIRKLTWDENSLMMNGKPLYLHGFGKHEDSDIRGKGLDLPVIIRDYNLIKWVGANAYRTSHYPYAEEIMDLADSMGIMVIDECPAVDIDDFNNELLENHKRSLTELVNRDKNRPSVIMWSVANEPRTQYPAAKNYFKAVIDHVKELDNTRPTTIVEAQGPSVSESSAFVDIVSFNRYNAWYVEAGNLDDVANSVLTEARNWRERFNKPVIMQEYGGDTLEGLHFLPEYIWSEEYQVKLMSEHFKAFDIMRKEGFFVGEFIWNFADFKTAQTYTRVGGNKKGIFTRNRQPKASAHFMRKRYWELASQLYNATLPDDLFLYTAAPVKMMRDEL